MYTSQTSYHLSTCNLQNFAKVADPWFPRWDGANSLGKGCQHTTLPKFPVGWAGGGSLAPIDPPMKGSWGRKLADFTFHPFWCDSSCQIWNGRYSLNGFEALTTVVFVKRTVMYDLALHNTSQPFWLSSGIIIDMHSNASIPLHLIGAMQWFLSCNRGPTQRILVQTTDFQMVVDWKFIRSILYVTFFHHCPRWSVMLCLV